MAIKWNGKPERVLDGAAYAVPAGAAVPRTWRTSMHLTGHAIEAQRAFGVPRHGAQRPGISPPRPLHLEPEAGAGSRYGSPAPAS